MVVKQVGNSVNIATPSRFSEFKQPANGFYIQPATNSDAQNEDNIDKKKLWLKIGLGVALVGITSVGVFKAMPKSVSKKFDKFKQHLEKKIEKEATNSKTAIFYRTVLKVSNSIAEKCQGVNNVISFKDILFKRRVSDKVPILKKACDGISKWFDDIGKFTVRSSYKSSQKSFEKLDDVFFNFEHQLSVKRPNEVVTINGVTKTVAGWTKQLAGMRQKVATQYAESFSVGKVNERFAQVNKIMDPLEDYIWNASFGDKKNFVKKDTYFTFVADKFLAVDKAKYVRGINDLRSQISYNLADRIKAMRNLLSMNKKLINPKDSVSEGIYRNLSKQLTELGNLEKTSPQYGKLQKEILENMDAFKRSLIYGKDKFKYDDSTFEALNEQQRIIKEILFSEKKGTLDEMLEIYKKLLDKDDFAKLSKTVNSSVQTLDKGINNEAVEYFDKLRDLRLGSAPTDILTILFGFGSLGIGLARADDKDTQTSIALKYGIPAIGGMLTSLVMTSMLISGTKSLFWGMGVSTFVMNKLGTYADKKRKKYQEEQRQLLAQQQLDKVLNKQKEIPETTRFSILQKLTS